MTKVNRLLLEEEPVYGPSSVVNERVPVFDGTSGKLLKDSGKLISEIGSGDVVGPASSVNNRVVLFDGSTGKLIKDSNKLIQTSVTDPTVGNLMGVGAFGLGKTVALTSPDLSSVRPSGMYYVSSPTNGPIGVTNGWLDVRDLDADHSLQTLTNVANGVKYSNLRASGVWKGWWSEQDAFMHVREEQAQNVAGGAAVIGANNRILNVVKFNSISGASLASSVITLPEGTYKIEIKSPGYAIDAFKIALIDSVSAELLLEGINAFSWNTTPSASTFAELTGILTVPSGGKTVAVRLYATVAKIVNGLGVPINRTGLVEIYTDVMIKRIR